MGNIDFDEINEEIKNGDYILNIYGSSKSALLIAVIERFEVSNHYVNVFSGDLIMLSLYDNSIKKIELDETNKKCKIFITF